MSFASRVSLVWAIVGVLGAGCGTLRRLPIDPVDGGVTGAAGVGGGGAGRDGGGAGIGGRGGVTGTGGSPLDAAVERVTFDALPDGSTCMPGAACTVAATTCHMGTTTCSPTGVASCTDTQQPQANGTVCGTDRVCHDGTCGACADGMTCTVPSKPCRTGSIVCTTGLPVCTESGNQPSGTSCGTNMICQAGQCVTCQSNAPCTPTNPCHQGTLSCTTGAPQCTDTSVNFPAGTACGQDRVCSPTGACITCATGGSCTVAGRPCRTGTVACSTGALTCAESGNVADGTMCGTNQVCSGGSCVGCTAGLSCTPANPCHTGTTQCSPISCMDTGGNLANGTACGTDRVCSAGTCVACSAGASCQPSNVCKTGATSCATGSSVCAETGNRPNGTTCGTNLVCMSGNCVSCSAGTACVPTNPCHTGTLTCNTGAAVCMDTGQSQPNGTSCGANLVCSAGGCVSCTAGQPCNPTNPCKFGMTSCSTGTSVCGETGNKPTGTMCGPGQSCMNAIKTTASLCNANGMCGSTMVPCPNGCNATMTDCSACLAGETMCPTGGCKNLSIDVMNCGMCGQACPSPPVPGSGSPTCANGTCGIVCSSGFEQCGGNNFCERTGWGFEDGQLGGFGITAMYPTAITSVSVSAAIGHSGSRNALAIGIRVAGNNRGFEVGLKLCGPGGFLAAKGRQVTAWFYLQPATSGGTQTPIHPQSYFGERLYTEQFNGGNVQYYSTPDTWFSVTTPIEQIGTQLYQLAVEGYFNSTGASDPAYDWQGTVYIDDIQIQ